MIPYGLEATSPSEMKGICSPKLSCDGWARGWTTYFLGGPSFKAIKRPLKAELTSAVLVPRVAVHHEVVAIKGSARILRSRL